ncbi:MAG: prolipoprotein diacylglyceryl transferase [Bryobacteraceae bacterium]
MLPYVVTIFGFHIPTYGLMVAIAFLSAISLTGRMARQAGYNPETVLNLGVYCAMAGILGAKLTLVLVDLPDYLRDPGQLLSLSFLQAMGIFYGGFIAALLMAYVYMRKHSMPVLATADLFAPGIALGHAIGRIGCFAAGCCWGDRCLRPWAVTFTNPAAHELVGVPLNVPLHPTQLYESISEFLILAVLLIRARRAHQPGALIGLYVVMYSIVRFISDFFREPQQANPFGGPFNTAQWISLGLIALVVVIWARTRGNRTVLAHS